MYQQLCFLSEEGPSQETFENYSLHFGSTLTFPIISLRVQHCLRSTLYQQLYQQLLYTNNYVRNYERSHQVGEWKLCLSSMAVLRMYET